MYIPSSYKFIVTAFHSDKSSSTPLKVVFSSLVRNFGWVSYQNRTSLLKVEAPQGPPEMSGVPTESSQNEPVAPQNDPSTPENEPGTKQNEPMTPQNVPEMPQISPEVPLSSVDEPKMEEKNAAGDSKVAFSDL